MYFVFHILEQYKKLNPLLMVKFLCLHVNYFFYKYLFIGKLNIICIFTSMTFEKTNSFENLISSLDYSEWFFNFRYTRIGYY